MQTIWLSPTDFVTGDESLELNYPSVSHPSTVVTSRTSGDFKGISMGLRLPEEARIEELIICYQVSNSRSFISQIRLVEMNTPNEALVIYDDTTDLQSVSPVCYSSNVGGQLISPGAALSLELRLNFGHPTDEIRLGAVGVKLRQVVVVPDYLKADLPVPGKAGRIARLVDDVRGLWLDNGINWEQVDSHAVNILNYPDLSAAITDIGAARRTLLIPISLTVAADVSVPSNVTLSFVGSGQLSIDSGVTVTLASPPLAGKNQIFASAGRIAWSRPPGLVDPVWWGAKYDDTADDSPAIQAAIDSLGSITAERRAGMILQISGPAAIANTILVQKKALIIQGLGNGYYGVTTPTQPYLRWIGPAGQPMIRIQDVSAGVHLRNLRFIGQASAPPSAAISLFETDDGIPTFQHMFENIEISNNGLGGKGFENGIWIQGTSSIQNDTTLWQNIYIDFCLGAGIRIGGIQNTNHNFYNLTIRNCSQGMWIASSVNVESVLLAQNETDFFIPERDDHLVQTGPLVQVRLLSSEGSSRFIEWQGDGQFWLDGGYWQIGAHTNADGKLIKADNDLDQLFHFAHFAFTQVDTPPHAPYISMIHTGTNTGRPFKRLYLEHVGGLEDYLRGGFNGTPFDFGPALTAGAFYFVEYLTIANPVPDRSRAELVLTRNLLTENRLYEKNRFDYYKRSSLPGETQSISQPSDQIVATSELVVISNTTGSSVTLNSAATITDGEDGQFLVIINAGTDDVVLQDQGTLANSNLRLTAGTVRLGPRHSISMVYLSAVKANPTDRGDWVQIGNLVPVL